MKRILLTAMMAVSALWNATAQVYLTPANFPDEKFRTYLTETFDKTKKGYLTTAEVANIREMDCAQKGIESLVGIKKFTALEKLECYNNQLKTLDVSENTSLKELYCFGNQLTRLDVSKNTVLVYLYCNGNQLTSLDVSENTALQFFCCSDNQLTRLDISKNTKLNKLDCSRNQLGELNLSVKNEKLRKVDVSENRLGGTMMDKIAVGLPKIPDGVTAEIVLFNGNGLDGNVALAPQIKYLKNKGWTVDYYNYKYGVVEKVEYDGMKSLEVMIKDKEKLPDGVDETLAFNTAEWLGELKTMKTAKGKVVMNKDGKRLFRIEGGVVRFYQGVSADDKIQRLVNYEDRVALRHKQSEKNCRAIANVRSVNFYFEANGEDGLIDPDEVDEDGIGIVPADAEAQGGVRKYIENGRVVIVRGGEKYNILGGRIK